MSQVARFYLPMSLVATALSSCVCERDVFNVIPDAGPPPDAGVPDAGPPPPEYPLKAGDKLKYPPPNNVTFCNESFATNCTEHSATWTMEFTVSPNGPYLDPGSNAWVIPAEYYWQVAEKKPAGTEDPEFSALSKLWLTDFGPWHAETGASHSDTLNFATTTAMSQHGAAETFPFFDVDQRFDAAAQAFTAFVKGLDPNARVTTQKAARKLEAGFLEPGDQSQLHFVQLIYHRLGFICHVSESVGPWDPNKPKSDTGFANNQRDFKSNVEAPQLTRAAGPKANQRQTCKCTTVAGNTPDCE